MNMNTNITVYLSGVGSEGEDGCSDCLHCDVCHLVKKIEKISEDFPKPFSVHFSCCQFSRLEQ